MAERPNILWILADQMAGHAMSCAGSAQVRTPNLDRLAAEGVRFRHACSSYPICVPFRFTMLTGERAVSRWVPTLNWRMSPAERTVAHVLHDAGYVTSYIGKWHLYGSPLVRVRGRHRPTRIPRAFRGGFQRWRGFELRNAPFDTWYFKDDDPEPRRLEGYQTQALFRLAEEELGALSEQGDPFFLVLSVEPPHPPYQAPRSREPGYVPSRRPPRANVNPEAVLAHRPDWGGDADAAAEELAGRTGHYAEMIEDLDARIGELMETLDAKGLLENTVVLFFSDHGEMLGSHGHIGKYWPYEESIGIPMIARLPGGTQAGTVVDTPACTEDLYVTTLAWAGLDAHDKPGRDMMQLATGQVRRDLVFLEYVHPARPIHAACPPYRGCRSERWKYVVTADGPWLLFDLLNDPLEEHNLVDAPTSQPVREALHERLMGHLNDSADPFALFLSEDAGGGT